MPNLFLPNKQWPGFVSHSHLPLKPLTLKMVSTAKVSQSVHTIWFAAQLTAKYEIKERFCTNCLECCNVALIMCLNMALLLYSSNIVSTVEII